ncbi:MAG: replicative DNA helicase, partial [Gammaproteobacteria bacterium]
MSESFRAIEGNVARDQSAYAAAARGVAERLPPQSIEAEQSVLGGLMLDNAAWDEVADRVTESDFYRKDHRLIFRAVADLAERSAPFDVLTLSEWFGQNGVAENEIGLTYLAELARNTPSAANIKHYADIVRERSVLRQLVTVSGEIGTSAFAPDGRTVADLLDEAEQKIFQIADQSKRAKKGFRSMSDLLSGAVDRLDLLYQSGSNITGISTGFNDLDDRTSGLQKGDLVIVAGRPSMGKTAFSMNLVEYAAVKQELPVAVFSMEMPGEQLAMRMMSSFGRINASRLRTGKLEDEDWPRVTSAVTLLQNAPVYIDDTPALTPTDLRARARRLKREHGLGMIVVDYLQLMRAPGSGDNRANEIAEISRNMKALAKELEVPVIALSQLNRSLEQRPNKRPVMSDLRESGSIEQDADLILFLYRDEVYNEDSPDRGTAEVIIGKQRNGPIGTVR